MQIQRTFGFCDKEAEAISFIREHKPKGEPYYLAFSGGKDSAVIHHLTKRARVKFKAYYAFTGIDPPELAKFVKQFYPDVKWLRPEKSIFAFMQYIGYPTRNRRWCCDKLKKEPGMAIPLKHRLVGIRKEESAKRASRGRVSYYEKYDQVMYKPIFDWLEWEVWDYINRHKVPYCPLYDQGFSRLGCVVCPFICSEDRKLVDIHMNRWPRQYRAFEKAMARLYRKRKSEGKWQNYYSLEHLLDCWYKGITMVEDGPSIFDNGGK